MDLNVILSCGKCGRDTVVPRQHVSPGMPCRGCGERLPEVGIVQAPGDRKLGDLLGSTTSPVFVAFHAGETLSSEGIRQLQRVAAHMGKRALVAVAAGTKCPASISACEIKKFPAYVFLQSGVWIALLERNTDFDQAFKWMMATLAQYEMPPMTYKPAPCLRCQGRTLIRCLPVEHGVEGGDVAAIRFRRLAVTHAARLSRDSFYGVRKVGTRTDAEGAKGQLEAFVCRSCGHVDWFASDPANIPIGPQHRTELIQVTDTNPYR